MTFNDKNQDKTQADAPLKHSWGSRFKAAREAMNLSEKDAAARLHLKPNLITIIENERFESGPPPIFMRGYIRSYARLLNMPEKEITQALSQLDLANPATSSPVMQPRVRMSTPNNNSNVGWSTTLVVLVLVGLVGMWWNTHYHNNPNQIAPEASTAIPLPVAAAPLAPTPAAEPLPATANANPADPTPKELVNTQPPVAAAQAQPAPVAESLAQQPGMAATAPVAPQAAPGSALATAPTPQPTQTPNLQPTEAQAIPGLNDGAQTPIPEVNDQAAQAAQLDDTLDGDVKPVKPKRLVRSRAAEVTSDDLVAPEEQGLEPDDNNN